jgi:hypothetical protein
MPSSLEKTAMLSILPESPIGAKDLPRRIQITDGTLSLIAKGFGEIKNLSLPAGVYQARVESSEKPFEQMIFLAPGKEVSVSYPLHGEVLASAAPVPGSDAMHETMRDPLELAVARAGAKPSRLLLMATHSGRGRPSIDLTGFRLLDAQGKEVCRLSEESIAGKQNAFRLFSQDVDEGGLVLEGLAENFAPGVRIRQPLWCSAGWCTLIFIGVNSNTGVPDLNSASVYIWRIGSSFAPESPENKRPDEYAKPLVMKSQQYTELALHSLANGRNLLSMEEVDTNLLVEKFSNPMLGILGCHLLFQQPSKDETLIQTVITNLNGLLPEHPDVIALRVMARQAGLKDVIIKPLPPAAWPPMLRRGFMAVRDQDWQQSGTVQPSSLYDRVRTRALNGGVWTRWIADKLTEFLTPPANRSAASSLLSWGLPKFAASLTSYAANLVSAGKKLRAGDLRWSGLNQNQARAALRVLSAGLGGGSRPIAKKAYAKKKAAPKARRKIASAPQRKAAAKKAVAKARKKQRRARR